MANSVIAQLKDRLAAKLHEIIPAVQRVIHPHETHAPKARNTAILVVGLLPQQAGIIVQEFGEAFDLRFWKDGNPKELDAQLRGVEGVYVLTTMVSHWMTDKIKAHSHVVHVSGMDKLRTALTARFMGET